VGDEQSRGDQNSQRRRGDVEGAGFERKKPRGKNCTKATLKATFLERVRRIRNRESLVRGDGLGKRGRKK